MKKRGKCPTGGAGGAGVFLKIIVKDFRCRASPESAQD